jgi:hypothetical protein
VRRLTGIRVIDNKPQTNHRRATSATTLRWQDISSWGAPSGRSGRFIAGSGIAEPAVVPGGSTTCAAVKRVIASMTNATIASSFSLLDHRDHLDLDHSL